MMEEGSARWDTIRTWPATAGIEDGSKRPGQKLKKGKERISLTDVKKAQGLTLLLAQ